jgi:hypothetical protein
MHSGTFELVWLVELGWLMMVLFESCVCAADTVGWLAAVGWAVGWLVF